MDMTFVRDDQSMVVDGVAKTLDLPPDFLADIHAIQWRGDSGEAEMRDPGTKRMTANKELASLDEFSELLRIFAESTGIPKQKNRIEVTVL